MMQIELNGQSRVIVAGTTVAMLLGELELESRYLAVERNRELVPRADHARAQLTEGDCIEVVTLVGGG
jgi:sulfur carrier protein